MLHRHTPEGLVIISQPAHAWISGQIARQWGNASFEAPAEEVCFAAEQHDIGFLGWEQSPTLNPKTGLPHTFMEMPTPMHLDIWRTGIQQMARFGRYPALLVSMHFTSVVQQHGTSGRSPADQKLVNRFLTEQCQIQADWVASLRNHSNHQPDTAHIHRDQGLVSLWDWLSLLLCMGLTEQKLITGV